MGTGTETQRLAVLVAAAVLLAACSGPGATAAGGRRSSGGGTTPAAETSQPRMHSPAGAPAVGALDPSLFEAGSCVALAPTHGNRHETVFLDAGHGGVDPGAVGTTDSGAPVYEKDLTLPVELDAAALLRADGYRVVVSRTNGGPVARPRAGAIAGGIYTTTGAHDELAARDICANLADAQVLVGIYFDAGESPLNAGSVTAYDDDRPFSAANKRLADLLQRNVLDAMNARGWQIPDGGVNLDIYDGGPPLTSAAASYDHLMLLGPAMAGYFTTPSEMPGAVVEPLFVTDPFEATIAVSTLGQHVIAGAIAETVEEFLG
jgi:N-acetylmuramoyl-L-alanine amidase